MMKAVFAIPSAAFAKTLTASIDIFACNLDCYWLFKLFPRAMDIAHVARHSIPPAGPLEDRGQR